eukprot:104071-Chlamydomonas_euryale.AAC.1
MRGRERSCAAEATREGPARGGRDVRPRQWEGSEDRVVGGKCGVERAPGGEVRGQGEAGPGGGGCGKGRRAGGEGGRWG